MAGKKSAAKESSTEVKEVVFEGEDASAEYLKAQDEALVHYRLTGDRGSYVDPTRDQEPDIAPELGVHPDPAQSNPAVYTPFATVASGPVVESFEDKVKNAEQKDSVDLNLHLESDESPKAADTQPGH